MKPLTRQLTTKW